VIFRGVLMAPCYASSKIGQPRKRSRILLKQIMEVAWKAAQFRDLKRDDAYYMAGCHAGMAMRMRGLGCEIRKAAKKSDLAATTLGPSQSF
jgi:hypothetical protein